MIYRSIGHEYIIQVLEDVLCPYEWRNSGSLYEVLTLVLMEDGL